MIKTEIHPTAIIKNGAVIGEGVNIGPYVVVDGNVRLGKNVCVKAHAYLTGITDIGEDCFIGPGAVIGEMPQMAGLKENVGRLSIGKNNIIREYVTIHTSTTADKTTYIGDNNFFMGFSHIAHDCQIKNNIVICNGALIAGHAQIDDFVFISGNVAVHQFVHIGRLAMIGGLSRVNQDVPPFMMVVGDSAVWGLNLVGLKRRGFTIKDIADIKNAFSIFYRNRLARNAAIAKLAASESSLVKEMAEFIKNSKRGVCGGHQRDNFWQKLFLDYPYFIFMKISAHQEFINRKNAFTKAKSL